MNKEKAEKIQEIISIGLMFILIIVLSLAIQQRYFENQKCEKWSEERILFVYNEEIDQEYDCELKCEARFENG